MVKRIPATSPASPPAEADFSPLDGRKVAVKIRVGQDTVIFRGLASLQNDDALGKVLNVAALDDEQGAHAVLLSASNWSGRIIPDFHYGCDYCLIPVV